MTYETGTDDRGLISSLWETMKTTTMRDQWDMNMVKSQSLINLQWRQKVDQQKEQPGVALYINKEISTLHL